MSKLNLRILRRTRRAGGFGVSIRVALRSVAATIVAAAAVKIAGAEAFHAALHGVAARQGPPCFSHGLLSQRRTCPGRVRRFATDPAGEAAIEKFRESERQDENKFEETASLVVDDGRVLDTSTLVGFVGAAVVGIALLPYPALVFYTAWSLATSGRLVEIITVQTADGGFKLASTALLGVLQCFSLVVVFGLVLWSSISSIARSTGLPAGPLGLLALCQDLAFIGAFIFAVAFGLNSLGPSLNPLSGLASPLASPDQILSAAQKASKLAEKGVAEATKLSVEASKLAEKEQIEFLAATAPQRKELDVAVADTQRKASESLSSAQAKASESLSNTQAKLTAKFETKTEKQVSGKDAPVKDTQNKDAPAKDTPNKDAPSKDLPSTDKAKKDAPEKAEVKDSPTLAASTPALPRS